MKTTKQKKIHAHKVKVKRNRKIQIKTQTLAKQN